MQPQKIDASIIRDTKEFIVSKIISSKINNLQNRSIQWYKTTPFYLQFEKVEAQFEKAEVQFEKGEAQFEKDEVQFEIPEIQFEKDETQIEKDNVGFEITKIQFEMIAISQFETPLGNYGMNIPACAYQPCL